MVTCSCHDIAEKLLIKQQSLTHKTDLWSPSYHYMHIAMVPNSSKLTNILDKVYFTIKLTTHINTVSIDQINLNQLIYKEFQIYNRMLATVFVVFR